jgi:hypothetical protein
MRQRTGAAPIAAPLPIGLACVLAFGCAQAQDLKAAQACTRLADDAARLLCYDSAYGVARASAPSQSAGAAKADVQAKFGDDGRIHPEAKPNLPKSLTAQVQQVAVLPGGNYQMTLDNGQVWRTTEADSALAFKVGDAVTLSRLLLGGYEISLRGHTTSVSAVRMK